MSLLNKKDKKLNDDITIKQGPYGVYLKLANNTNVKLPKKYKTILYIHAFML
jgi:topoisomerase IA-like protein